MLHLPNVCSPTDIRTSLWRQQWQTPEAPSRMVDKRQAKLTSEAYPYLVWPPPLSSLDFAVSVDSMLVVSSSSIGLVTKFEEASTFMSSEDL